MRKTFVKRIAKTFGVAAAAITVAAALWLSPSVNQAGDSVKGAASVTIAEEPAALSAAGNASVLRLGADGNYTLNVPAYSGIASVAVNNNVPGFAASDLTSTSYESYSELDSLGRCQVAAASIGKDLMPTQKRGSIGSIKPSGWVQNKYPGIVDAEPPYLYNRCHLIGYQLTGENANEKNLITGTRYMNVEGMLPYENLVADYVESTGNHVLYRVTPVFLGNNLVASGVQIEAESVEDSGAGLMFNAYCYNLQPGVTIDYATGNNAASGEAVTTGDGTSDAQTSSQVTAGTQSGSAQQYVLNTNTKKFHYPSCSSVSQMSDKNKKVVTMTRDEIIAEGYEPCKRCNP